MKDTKKSKEQLIAELAESEEKYRKLFENMMDGLVLHRLITDKNGHPVDYIIWKVNKAAEKILSWNRKDVEGKKATEVYSGDTPFIERYAKVAQTGKAEYFVDYYPRFKKWYEITSFCPKKGCFANVFRDITEHKQAEQTLIESEEKYRTVFENTGTATLIIEEDTIISMVNTQFEKLSGYSKDEIEKKIKWTDFVIPEYLERMKKYHIARRKVGEKIPTEYEFRFTDKKGKIKNIFLKVGIIPGTKKSIASLIDITESKQAEERLKKTMDATIDTMSKIIEAKDPYTSGHQHRVCQLAVSLAQELNLSKDKIEGIRIASLIHDIGKIGLPTEILSKPTKLTDIEFSLIKGHSQIGYDILKSIDFSYPIARIVLQHHERINGSGYPNNLKGDEIILEAKIIGVADVVEAMSSFRPYRPALGIDKALEEIIQNRGTFYDPEVVDVCLKLFKEKEFKFE